MSHARISRERITRLHRKRPALSAVGRRTCLQAHRGCNFYGPHLAGKLVPIGGVVMPQSRNGNGSVATPGARDRLSRLMGWSSGTHQAKGNIDALAILESLDGAVIARGLDGVIRTWNSG